MQQFSITSNDADQRLDKFLKKLFPNATLGFLYKLNRKGNIKIITTEEKKIKKNNEYKLQLWEKVQVFLSDTDIEDLRATIPLQKKATISEKLLPTDIIFEDEALLIVNKNPNQNVHPADHKSQEVSLIEQAQDYLGDQYSSLTFKPSLIHRIDRDTSGIVMIAKDKHVLMKLSEDFRKKNSIQKTYFTLCVWKFSRSSGSITKKLKRIENAHNENKVQVSEWWKEAITHFKVLREHTLQLPQGEQIISEVEVTIETGRMHQIRVHMAAIGTPVLWDNTYGNKWLNHYFFKHFWLTRQMLHAWKIEFFHPQIKKKLSLEAKLKADMLKLIKKIKE